MNKGGRRRSFFLGVLAFLVLAVALPAQAQEIILPPEDAAQIKLSFAPVVRKIAPAVVSISSKRIVTRRVNPFLDDPFFAPFFQQGFGGLPRQRVESALGSGVLVDAKGLVVTNAHVVRGADEITVTLADGREFEGKVSVSDDASDIALVRISALGENFPAAQIGSSESLETGDLVIAVGNPFGVGQTVTSGIVSARARPNLDINDFNFFIQTDAAINPGNSGGPLVDMSGRIVGINTAIYSRDGGSLGIGFAVPVEMVRTVIAAEGQGGGGSGGVARAWLGVTMQDITSDIARGLDLDRPRGALVTRIGKGSPAAAAGLRVGDAILAIDGREILNAAELHFRWATIPVGGKAEFKVWRKNRALSVSIPARLPPDEPPRAAWTVPGGVLAGATLVNLNPSVIAELNLPDDAQGVVVLKIDPRKSAARIVAKGDVLLSVNGREVGTVAQARKALADGAGGGIDLVISRAGQTRRIVMR